MPEESRHGKKQDKKQNKKSYLQDFKKNAGGSYVYTGVTWQADPALRRQMLRKLWALQGVMFLSVLLPGVLTTAGLQNTFYVIIPYVIWFLSDIVLAYTLGSITAGGNPLRDYVYQRSVLQYAVRTVFPLAGAGLTALTLAVFLLRGGKGDGVIVCFVCCAVQIGLSVCAKKTKIAEIWKC